jgi:hypothetical protein
MTTDNAVTNMLAPGSAPIVPTAPSPALAAAKLEVLTSNSEWGAKFMAGDSAARAEFNELTSQIAAGDKIADALAGQAPPSGPFVETITDGELPSGAMRTAIAHLQLHGLTDTAVQEVLTGKTFSKAELRAAEDWRERAMRDELWRKNLLAGDPVCARELLVANCIVAAGTGTT